MARFGVMFVFALFVGPASGFFPATNKIPATSRKHQQITEASITTMATIYMTEYPDDYPDQAAALATSDFKTALRTFLTNADIPDTDNTLANQPELHFNSEQIIEGNEHLLSERIRVLNSITSGDMTAAREVTGQLLHTLQDFYSHTNWIELGETSVNIALGDPAMGNDIGTVAGPDDKTCEDCLKAIGSCPNNILDNITSNNLLTSGYFRAKSNSRPEDPDDHKPPGKGKCSHGGQTDITRNQPAIGGINKDTNSDKYSPHSHLHTEAASLAEEACVEFLKNIRRARSDIEFATFLGLRVGASLCFVVDTTGSMSGEIEAVRQATIDITRARAGSSNAPSEYVLAPFNDPDFGPVFKTTDPEAMIDELSALGAIGGGDEPELFFNGLILALNAVRPGSECFTFTDASAKDADLLPTAITLATSNSIKVNVVLTGPTPSGKRKRRDTTRRRKRQTTSDYYAQIAALSGGQYILTDKTDIGEVIKVVDAALTAIQVNVVKLNNVVASGALHEVVMPVDETTTNFTITLTTSGSIDRVEIRNPAGEVLTPGSGDIDILTDVANVKLYAIGSPVVGLWTIGVAGSGMLDVQFNARSVVDFSIQFVEYVDFGHGGYRVISGKPIQGTNQTIIVKIFGGTVSPKLGLTEVTALLLVTAEGSELQRLSLQALEPLVTYEASTTLPTEGFRVVLEGVDSSGNNIQRWDTKVITTARSNVQVSSGAVGVYTFHPGQSISVNLTVTNYGTVDTYNLTATDSEGFVQAIEPMMFQLDTNETAETVVTCKAPDNATVGQTSTVSVTAISSVGNDGNYLVFRLTTVSAVPDTEPPMCTILNSEGECAQTKNNTSMCETEIFHIEFVAHDTGSGLYAIRPEEIVSTATFNLDAYDPGTDQMVGGNYTSNCCHPRVTIVVSDGLGNSRTCAVDYFTSTTTTTTTTAPSPTTAQSGLGNAEIAALSLGDVVFLIAIPVLVVTDLVLM